MKKNIHLVIAVFTFLTLGLASVWAQFPGPAAETTFSENTITGSDYLWNTSGNWDNGVPTTTATNAALDDARIGDNQTAYYDSFAVANPSFGTLTIGQDATFRYAAATNNLGNSGGLDWNNGKTIYFEDGAHLNVIAGIMNSQHDLYIDTGNSATYTLSANARIQGTLTGAGNLEIIMGGWVQPRIDMSTFSGNTTWTSSGGGKYLREFGGNNSGQALGAGTNTIGSDVRIEQSTSHKVPDTATVVLVGAANGNDEKWKFSADRSETIANLIIQSPIAASTAPYIWVHNGYLKATDSVSFTGAATNVYIHSTYSPASSWPGELDARGADVTFGGTGEWTVSGNNIIFWVDGSSTITTTTNATISCLVDGSFTKAGSATLTLGDPSGVATPITLSEGSLVFEDNVTFAGGDYITFDDSTSSFTADFGGSFATLASVEAEIGPADNFRLGSGVSGALWEYDNGDGTFTVRGDKVIVNRDATDLLGTSATLNGILADPDTNYTVSVYWGETDATTNAMGWDDSALVGSWTNVSRTNIPYSVTNLTPATTYYFRYLATNDTTNVWASPSLSFTTLDTPVVNNSTGATPIDATSATLRGALTGGTLADAWVCWGESDAGALSTNLWDNVESIGSVSTGAVFSTTATGLETNRTYFYRCYAENGLGSDWSDSAESFSGTPAGGAGPSVDPVSGFDFFVDAGQDTDGDQYWEDLTVGNPTGLGLLLDSSPAVVRTNVSSSTELTHAYVFPGGSTGNEAGALLVNTGTSTVRSFQDVTGDWSDEDVTLEMWIKPADLTPTPANGQVLFEDGGGTGLGLLIDNNELVVTHDGSQNQIRYDLSTDPSNLLSSAATSEFLQAVVTHDVGSPYQTVLYVNGTAIGTSNDDGDWSGGDDAAFGTRGGSNLGGLGSGQMSTESFDGQIALIRLYNNQILNADEVMTNYLSIASSPSVIVNRAPSGVTNYQVTANATLSAAATNYTVYVHWGTADAGTNFSWENTSPAIGSWTNVSSTNMSYTLQPLPGSTTYFYTFQASNSTENVWASPSWTFVTAPLPSDNASLFRFR